MLMLDPLVSRTLAPVYHSWQPNQHTNSITQPFPMRVIQTKVGAAAETLAACGQVPVISKVLRNSRNSCVFEPSCRTFPLRMLRSKVPILCQVSLCLNCLGWYSAHLYQIPSRYGLDCPLTFMPPTSSSVKSPASSSGLVRSCRCGVSATHSPKDV